MSSDDPLIARLISSIRQTTFEPATRMQNLQPTSADTKNYLVRDVHHELGLAELFAITCGDLFMDVENVGPYFYAQGVWLPDTQSKRARRAISSMIKKLAQAPGPYMSDDDNKIFKNLLKRALNGRGVITIADKFYREQSISIADVAPNQLDPCDDLINTPDATYNLRTGVRIPHHPSQLHTRMTGVNPDFHMATPVWDKFMSEITAGDYEVQTYIELLFGYFLTGETKEELFHIFYGDGGNGKTTLMLALEAILGDYAVVGSANLFAGKQGEGARFEKPRLRGARAVLVPEGADGHRLDTAFIKQISSPGNIVSEAKFKDHIAHRNTTKAALSTNYHMSYGGKDGGMERRLVVLEFTAKFGRPGATSASEANRDLIQLIRPELPGILAKSIIRSMQWYKSSGLIAPTAIRRATERYLKTVDQFAAFEELCLENSIGSAISASTLMNLYNNYARSLKLRPMNSHEMKRLMNDRGYHQKRTSLGMQWVDLSITEAGKQYLPDEPT